MRQIRRLGNNIIYKDKQIGEYKSAEDFIRHNTPEVIFKKNKSNNGGEL